MPPDASCIKVRERRYALVGERVIRGGSFRDVREARQRIELLVKRYNQDPLSFKRNATAVSIPADS